MSRDRVTPALHSQRSSQLQHSLLFMSHSGVGVPLYFMVSQASSDRESIGFIPSLGG